MPNYTVSDVLHTLFADAHALMQDLSKTTGSFTSQQFFKQLAQRNQVAYIELLQRCLGHEAASPFNAAHQHLGKKLSEEAAKWGYTQSKDPLHSETDIFGNPTARIVYTRNQQG